MQSQNRGDRTRGQYWVLVNLAESQTSHLAPTKKGSGCHVALSVGGKGRHSVEWDITNMLFAQFGFYSSVAEGFLKTLILGPLLSGSLVKHGSLEETRVWKPVCGLDLSSCWKWGVESRAQLMSQEEQLDLGR